MMDFQHAEHVAASPDRLYDVLANPDNLVHFVPQLTNVKRTDGDHLEVEARYEGHTQRGQAYLRTDESAHRVEWGVEGGGYHGSFDVTPDGDGSKLVLKLTTVHTGDVDHDVAGTLDAIRRLLEAEV
jgi:carbon monoxide dehydrogenase subunit G